MSKVTQKPWNSPPIRFSAFLIRLCSATSELLCNNYRGRCLKRRHSVRWRVSRNPMPYCSSILSSTIILAKLHFHNHKAVGFETSQTQRNAADHPPFVQNQRALSPCSNRFPHFDPWAAVFMITKRSTSNFIRHPLGFCKGCRNQQKPRCTDSSSDKYKRVLEGLNMLEVVISPD